MLRRSVSPAKLSSAITSETVMGKKPTIISRKGMKRSAITLAPYWRTKPTTWPAVKFIRAGKNKVSTTTGKTIRQSRSWSRTSR